MISMPPVLEYNHETNIATQPHNKSKGTKLTKVEFSKQGNSLQILLFIPVQGSLITCKYTESCKLILFYNNIIIYKNNMSIH